MKKNNLTFETFADFMKANEIFPDMKTKTWNQFSYGEMVYREMEMCELKRLTHHFLQDQSTSTLNEYLKKYQHLYGVNFDQENLFGFSNGVLNLKTDEFKSYSPDVFVKKDVDYQFRPKAKKWKKIKKFLMEVFDGDIYMARALLNIICLPLDISWAPPFILVLLGEGGNGKSVLIELLTLLYGKERVSFLSVDEYQDKFKTGLLVNRTLNVSEENTKKFSSTVLKSLKSITSGTVLNVESKFEQPVPTQVKQVVVFALNKLPQLDETTDAIKRRLVVLRMVKIPPNKQNPFLIEELREELPAFFNYLLNRNKKLKAIGKVPVPVSVRRVSQTNLFPKSELKMFVLDHCLITKDTKDRVTKKELYLTYEKYCRGFSADTQNYQTFCKEILKEAKGVKSGKIGKEGQRKNCFIGIKLKTKKEEECF